MSQLFCTWTKYSSCTKYVLLWVRLTNTIVWRNVPCSNHVKCVVLDFIGRLHVASHQSCCCHQNTGVQKVRKEAVGNESTAEMMLFRKFSNFTKFCSVPPVQKNRTMYNFRKFLKFFKIFYSTLKWVTSLQSEKNSMGTKLRNGSILVYIGINSENMMC